MRTEAYRIRHGWGLRPIRNKRELKALIDFCRQELKEPQYQKNYPENKKAKEVYETTIELYEINTNALTYYIIDNARYYW